MSKPNLFTVGGTVQASNGLYISRQADNELLTLCRGGNFAYVLTPRQLGKSSLMVRTSEQLIAEGVRCVIIDLSQIGVQVTAEEWYLGLLTMIEEQLDLDTNVVSWWQERSALGLTQRLTLFFQEVLLKEVTAPIVIFVDEIDTTLSLNFTDDFFAAIRYFYNARARAKEFERLSFVLIGVATPGDLIRDPQRTPFNIGQRVDLTDFSFAEALTLAAGFGLQDDEARKLLSCVLNWTSGHPYLTQRLCQAITNQAAQARSGWSEAEVDRIVAATFIGERSEQDDNLRFVRDMLTERIPATVSVGDVIAAYRSIRRGLLVPDEEQSLIKSHLKLSGVVRRENGLLRVRNRIYSEVFDGKWVREHLPVNWTKRLTRAAAVLVLTMLVLSVPLGAYAWHQRNQSLDKAVKLEIALKSVERERQLVAAALAQAEVARAQADDSRRQAEAQTALAKKEGAKATRQREIAEEQRKLAQDQRQRAEAQKTIANEQRQRAEAQTRIAEEQRRKTEELRRASVFGGKIGAMAELTRNQQAKLLQRGVLLARESILRSSPPYVVPYQTLTQGLSLLPHPVAQLPSKELVNEVVFSPDGQFLATIAGEFINRVAARLSRAAKKEPPLAEENLVTIWETQSWKVKATLKHDNVVAAMAFSPNGKFLATASYDNFARVWDLSTGREVWRLIHPIAVKSVKFSPDGKYLATACGDNLISVVRQTNSKSPAQPGENTARIWDLATGNEIARMQHETELEAVVFSPNGKLLATASADKTARVWDALTGRAIARMEHNGMVNAVAFSPDSSALATASIDHTARMWKINEQPVREIARMQHNAEVTSVLFSPDGKLLATVAKDNTARLWVGSLDQIETLPTLVQEFKHEDRVRAATFSADGNYLATASNDDTARVWEINSGREVARMTHDGDVNSVAFTPNNKMLATGSDDQTARAWKFADDQRVVRRILQDGVERAIVSPDGRFLATVRGDATVRISETANGQAVSELEIGSKITALIFSQDGKYLATRREGNNNNNNVWEVTVWEVTNARKVDQITNGRPLTEFSLSPHAEYLALVSESYDLGAQVRDTNSHREVIVPHGDRLSDIFFSPGGRYLATVSTVKNVIRGEENDIRARVHTVKIFDAVSRRQRFELETDGPLRYYTFSPDDQYLFLFTDSKRARLIELESGKEVAQVQFMTGILNVAFSPTGKKLAIAQDNGIAWLGDPFSNEHRLLLKHEGAINSIAFSPDGNYVATGSADNTARVWDAKSGIEIARITDEGRVNLTSFSLDGRYLNTVSLGHAAQSWLWQPQDLIQETCSRLSVQDLSDDDWKKYLSEDEWSLYMVKEIRPNACRN